MPGPTLLFALWASFLACIGGAGQAQAQQRRSNRQRPPLHNKNHEATIRNLLHPKFLPGATPLAAGNHTSNVAVIVSSSRYWFNYRHVTNALSVYHLLKRGGMTDDRIVLMLADEIPCNMRNVYRGKIFPRGAREGMGDDLMEDAEIDYTGTDVTVDAFLRVLSGRHLPGEEGTAGGRSLPPLDENTNVLVYLTGHGGDNFFKFQDGEELMSHDVASAFSQMYELKRYNEILFISDTCQAFTMADEIQVPGVFSVGSSLKGENSYASHSDPDVGQSVIDRYSKILKDFVDDAVTLTSSHATNGDKLPYDKATVAVMERLNLHDALVRIPMNHGELGPNSHVGHADHLCARKMNQVPLSDFFAASSVERVRQTNRRRVKASLWMQDDESTASGYRQPQAGQSAEECAIREQQGSTATNETKEEAETEVKRAGMSPFDPKFLAVVAGFTFIVHLSSRVF
ncbi:hypothetical protein ACHAXT_004130 [Thalassiosira profunda]